MLYAFSGLPAACQTLQLTVLDTDAAALTTLIAQLMRVPFATDEPLVAQTLTSGAVPPILHCTAPDGRAVPDKRVDNPFPGDFATPREALAAFVAQHTTVAAHGYTELILSDDSYAYGVPSASSDSVVTLVRIAKVGSRWKITSWESSGC